MEEMEQGKSQIDKLDREGDALEMERFAIEIFDRADKVDRAGAATEDTARRFYAASVFMTALETFGPLRDDLVTKGR